MKQVLKWLVPVDDKAHEIGAGRVIHADTQGGIDVVCVWTEEDRERPLKKALATIVGTGHFYEGTAVATVPLMVGDHPLVWHVVVNPAPRSGD